MDSASPSLGTPQVLPVEAQLQGRDTCLPCIMLQEQALSRPCPPGNRRFDPITLA